MITLFLLVVSLKSEVIVRFDFLEVSHIQIEQDCLYGGEGNLISVERKE